MTDSAPIRSGGCLCGAVRYETHGVLRPVVMCHCKQCQRQTGSVMAATASRLQDFRLLAQEPLRWFAASSEAQRGFCANCGSTLFWQAHGRDYVSIAAGTLDDTRGLHIACHIFVADKGAYYEIEDDTPHIEDGNFKVSWS
jgi:hypothetical protein